MKTQFQNELSRNGQSFTIENSNLRIQIPPNTTLTLANLMLIKDAEYLSYFSVLNDAEGIGAKSPIAIQQYIDNAGNRIEVGRVSWEFIKS